MFTSQTSINLNSDSQISDNSIQTMKTIRTEMQCLIQKRKLENIGNYSKGFLYQNSFQQEEFKQDWNKNIELFQAKSNPKIISGSDKNLKEKVTKLMANTIYSKQLEEKQKEFIKLITICFCLLITLVIIFHKKEAEQIHSLF